MDTTSFNFSIEAAVRHAWQLFRVRPWFYIEITAIMILLNIPGSERGTYHLLPDIFFMIMSIIFSYVTLSIFLAAIDEKNELLTFGALHRHLPNLHQLLLFLGVGIVTALSILAGLILLIIPGIYVAVRLSLSQFAYVDRQGSTLTALKYSWKFITKEVFWKVFLTCIVALGLMVCGAAFFGVGLLITYPLTMLLMASLYRALSTYHNQKESSTVQSPEISVEVSG